MPNGPTFYQANTNGYTNWSNDMQMNVSFFNHSMNISLTPAEIDPNTGKRSYTRKTASSGILTIERIAALNQIIQEEFIPAIHNHVEYFERAIAQNSNASTIIRLILKEEDDPLVEGHKTQNIYLELDLNLVDKIPETIMTYKFAKTNGVFNNYDPKTGDFTPYDTEIQSQFIIFATALNEFLHLYSGAVLHVLRMHGFNRMMQTIDEIAAKLGIERRRNTYRQNSGFDFNKNNQNNAESTSAFDANDSNYYSNPHPGRPEPTKVTTVNSMDELLSGDTLPF